MARVSSSVPDVSMSVWTRTGRWTNEVQKGRRARGRVNGASPPAKARERRVYYQSGLCPDYLLSVPLALLRQLSESPPRTDRPIPVIRLGRLLFCLSTFVDATRFRLAAHARRSQSDVVFRFHRRRCNNDRRQATSRSLVSFRRRPLTLGDARCLCRRRRPAAAGRLRRRRHPEPSRTFAEGHRSDAGLG